MFENFICDSYMGRSWILSENLVKITLQLHRVKACAVKITLQLHRVKACANSRRRVQGKNLLKVPTFSRIS